MRTSLSGSSSSGVKPGPVTDTVNTTRDAGNTNDSTPVFTAASASNPVTSSWKKAEEKGEADKTE